MENIIHWIEAHPALGVWMQSMAILLTGLCAIGAGVLGFRGASAQARVLRETRQAEKKDNEEREVRENQGKAAAISAELQVKAIEMTVIKKLSKEISDIIVNLPRSTVASAYDVTKLVESLQKTVSSTSPRAEIFESNPLVVSKFGGFLSVAVVQAYADNKFALKRLSRLMDEHVFDGGEEDLIALRAVQFHCDQFIDPTVHTIEKLIRLSGRSDSDRTDIAEWLRTFDQFKKMPPEFLKTETT